VVLREIHLRKGFGPDVLSRRNIGSDGHQLVKRAFDNGAFIAGGCASAMLRHDVNDLDDDGVERIMFDYLNVGSSYRTPTQAILDDVNSIPVWRTYGDIDLFFPDERTAQRYIYESKQAHPAVPNVRLRSGAAHEFVTSESLCVQVNLRNFGTMEQVIDTFDITNAMVAVSETRGVAENNVIDLIKRKELDLAVPANALALWRLSKWARKQRYERLTQRTGEDVSRFFIEYFSSEASLKTDDHKGWRKVVNETCMFAQSLTNEALLMLLSTPADGFDLSEDGYGGNLANAKKEFRQRTRALDGAGE